MADTSVKVSFIGDAKHLNKTMGELGTKSKSFGDKFTSGFQKALPVLAGVGAGVAVLSSAVKAAIEDEASASKLAETLKTVAGATNEQIAATEKWIDTTQRATGVADDELRPALDKLARSSSSVEEAQKNLRIAMDVSRGTGKDLDTVAQALAKVLEGNTAAASKLVPELIGIAREGASADEVMAALATTFKGQTEAHAKTTAGTMERLNIAFGEMKERVGAALLPKLTEFGNWMLNEGIPRAEQMGRDVAAWWKEQDELHKSLRDTAEQTKEFAIAMREMTEDAAAAYEKISPLVNIMWDLFEIQQKFNPMGIFGIGGKTINQAAQEEMAKPGSGITGGFQLPGRAAGGPVMAGGAYMVGERGPEVFVPGRSGSIVPNGAGASQIVLNIDGRSFMTWLVDASRDMGGVPITTRSPS